ncbi:MAG: hypothetical protein ABJA67_16325 [Chthonomonadales bacterium]
MKSFTRSVVLVMAVISVVLVSGCGEPKGSATTDVMKPDTRTVVTPVHVNTIQPVEPKTISSPSKKAANKSAKPNVDIGMFRDFNSVSGPAATELQGKPADEPDETHALQVVHKELESQDSILGKSRSSMIGNAQVIAPKTQ